MANKSTKSDWNVLLQDIKKTARTVRQYSEGAAAADINLKPELQDEFKQNVQLAARDLETCAMRLANITQLYDGAKPFAGQA
jgi:hypothetical protein